MDPKLDYLSRLNKTKHAQRHEKSMPPPASRPPREDEIMPCCFAQHANGLQETTETI